MFTTYVSTTTDDDDDYDDICYTFFNHNSVRTRNTFIFTKGKSETINLR